MALADHTLPFATFVQNDPDLAGCHSEPWFRRFLPAGELSGASSSPLPSIPLFLISTVQVVVLSQLIVV